VFLSDADAFFWSQRPNWRATDLLSVSLSIPKSRSHPFPDQGAFELCNCPEYLEHQLAGSEGCIYRVVGHEVNAEFRNNSSVDTVSCYGNYFFRGSERNAFRMLAKSKPPFRMAVENSTAACA
jgi:hypothetical protein